MLQEQGKKILYIKLPDGFPLKIEQSSFRFNPEIKIPVEVEDENCPGLENLTIEMILAAMLRLIAEGSAENLFYYRSFVLAVRPGILKEFGGAAILKARNNDFSGAAELIAILKALFPFSPDVLLINALVLEAEAFFLEQSGSGGAEAALKSAETAYREALSVEDPLPDAGFNAAFFYMKIQNYEKARGLFLDYMKNGKDDLKKEKAAAYIKDIEKKNLDDRRFNTAYKLIKDGNEEEGLTVLRPFLEENPGIWEGWFLLGWALRKLKRWENGRDALLQAIALGCKKADAGNELAICLMETGDFAGAKRQLEQALNTEPENIKIISNLAVLSLKQGDKAGAEAFFRTVLELAPGDALARRYFEN